MGENKQRSAQWSGGRINLLSPKRSQEEQVRLCIAAKKKVERKKIYRTNTRARLQILAIDIAGGAYYILTIKLLPSSPLFLSPLAVSRNTHNGEEKIIIIKYNFLGPPPLGCCCCW
jgi:hypothetical protein